ncbi:MAG: transcriptional regulator, TetR family [Solirubrobacterales bacterium]|jgi:AcrR family transcriptional regulator|nr:transcriptional regulator, TetR family [Solirubrobacterales bacterium]
MSQRHVTTSAPAAAAARPEALDPADGALLDAARACVMAVGMRRTTLTDVARRAGVSRMTVYRRFPDVEALLQALMTREFLAVLTDIVQVQAPTARERMALGATRGVRALSEHPLFNRLMDVDPELLMPYAFHRYGAFQRAVLIAFAALIREGIQEGSIRDEDPELLAVTLELMLRGAVLGARTEEVAADRAAICEQLGAMIDRALAP